MLFRMAPLPTSLKRPRLRFGLPTKRWTSEFVWALLPPLIPKPDSKHTHTHTYTHSLGQTSSVCSSLKCEVCDFHAVFNSFSQVMAAVLIISRFLYKVFRSHWIRVEQGHLTLTLTGNAGKVSIKSAAKTFGNSEGKCANWCANCIQNISNFI